MATYKRFEELPVWQKSRILAKDVFILASNRPLARDFELKDQMLASCGSVMDNIAEGFERNGGREFIQFLAISKGSCGELRSQLYRAFDRGYFPEEELKRHASQSEIISSELQKLMDYLNRSGIKGQKFK
jgi:four helix bundle protein